jgi:glycosyltransferase involved in cell wall biosynthesis
MQNIKDINIFLPSFGGGGAEHVVLRLIDGFIARGFNINLILATKHGRLRDRIPSKVNVIDLNCRATFYSLFALAKYMRINNPKILLSHINRANIVAILAKLISRAKTDVYIVEHNSIKYSINNYKLYQRLLLYISYRILYPKAAKIVHVSKYAASELEELFKWKKGSVEVVYNPVINEDLIKYYKAKPEHFFFKNNNVPIIISVGRFSEPKDFITVIDAFALVLKEINSLLIILGEGHQRLSIERRIHEHKINEYVSLTGYVENPLSYMNNASLLVLSSKWEALPTVLIEALACGCPVVSTDCPSGPAEILENGKYGTLVPVQDSHSLSDAIIKILSDPPEKKILMNRAMDFSVFKSVDKYIEIMNLK